MLDSQRVSSRIVPRNWGIPPSVLNATIWTTSGWCARVTGTSHGTYVLAYQHRHYRHYLIEHAFLNVLQTSEQGGGRVCVYCDFVCRLRLHTIPQHSIVLHNMRCFSCNHCVEKHWPTDWNTVSHVLHWLWKSTSALFATFDIKQLKGTKCFQFLEKVKKNAPRNNVTMDVRNTRQNYPLDKSTRTFAHIFWDIPPLVVCKIELHS